MESEDFFFWKMWFEILKIILKIIYAEQTLKFVSKILIKSLNLNLSQNFSNL